MRIAAFVFLLGFVGQAAAAQDHLVTVKTRESETIAYWWMPKAGAVASVLLFSGGAGGIGYREGQPRSGNFLIRSREYFRSENFNVALMGNPSDKRQLDDVWRVSENHLIDIANVIRDIRGKGSAQPVWLVGTSKGTVSVAAAAIDPKEKLAGAVLTASITNFRLPHSVPQQRIDRIGVPVLVYHHQDDACRSTVASETGWIMRALSNAPVKKLMIVTGGENPTGDPCEAFHWHGFVGMEARAVKEIADWVKNPQP